MSTKAIARKKRHARIKKRIVGTATCPRAQVFRSNRFITVQVIDDVAHKVICSYSDMSAKEALAKKTKVERATEVGTEVAKKMKEQGIEAIAFDRGGYQYHGRVKAVAEAMRAAGLQF